jgi:formylmethanofuran dehydrogenase subunit B
VLHVADGQITQAENACPQGAAWFAGPHPKDGPAAYLQGKPAPLDEALAQTIRLIRAARHPLVCGLGDTTCEAQRLAVALADRLGALLDTTTSDSHGPAGLAFQGVGEVTCTLGEVKNRADLVLFWGCDPVRNLPRHAERYSVSARGLFTPEGRSSRTILAVDVVPTETTALADETVLVRPGSDFEALWTLRCLVRGWEPTVSVEALTGVPLERWRALARRMKQCRFGVLFFGKGLTQSPGRHHNVEAVFSLVVDLNAHTRFYSKPMGAPGNVSGADNVVTWSTGYPFAVSFARGYPRFGPGEYGAQDVLARGEPDTALLIARDPLGLFPSAAARAHLRQIPFVSIGPAPCPEAAVCFVTAMPGIYARGTVYRMDDVALPLRVVLPCTLPTDEQVLSRLLALVNEGTAA